jgi:hypothetical protein
MKKTIKKYNTLNSIFRVLYLYNPINKTIIVVIKLIYIKKVFNYYPFNGFEALQVLDTVIIYPQ